MFEVTLKSIQRLAQFGRLDLCLSLLQHIGLLMTHVGMRFIDDPTFSCMWFPTILPLSAPRILAHFYDRIVLLLH